MQVSALIAEAANPDPETITAAMDDVLCRCGTYPAMRRGIRRAVELVRKEGLKA
jgi:aerobic-type carbon monoxide dehydrogenase small subunit (CoxS/CutS family)